MRFPVGVIHGSPPRPFRSPAQAVQGLVQGRGPDPRRLAPAGAGKPAGLGREKNGRRSQGRFRAGGRAAHLEGPPSHGPERISWPVANSGHAGTAGPRRGQARAGISTRFRPFRLVMGGSPHRPAGRRSGTGTRPGERLFVVPGAKRPHSGRFFPPARDRGPPNGSRGGGRRGARVTAAVQSPARRPAKTAGLGSGPASPLGESRSFAVTQHAVLPARSGGPSSSGG